MCAVSARRVSMNTDADAAAFVAPSETLGRYLDRALVEPTCTGLAFVDGEGEGRNQHQHQHQKHSHNHNRRRTVGALVPGEILEIVGPPGSGKTSILTEIASRATLTRGRSDGIDLGGSSATCVFVDCDGKFDQLRFLRTTDEKIADGVARAGNRARQGAREEIYEESMSRFTVVRAHAMLDVDAGGAFGERSGEGFNIDGSESTGGGSESARGDRRSRQRVVLIDNIAAFYWLDRASRKDHGAPYNIQRVFSAAARLLKRLATAHRAAIVVTKATLSTNEGLRGGEYRDFLPVEWSNAVTQRILLSPSKERVEYGEYAGVATWDTPVQRRGGKFVVTEQGIRC
ncbi:P-loop containing nucleoside triphosphate hydrolase protein [Ostreococcus tauri]|uniref:P-loop containing nucleoside triphosphate hydrolase protein n=1 Tax=Ostreococcus tauri TaxID=70448 RepID=A0A1Y5ID65_OSTTA|nr:P-loop containing nucleoside triphosphate hydrolase protein [Ostreococcus tauri]